MGRLAAGSLFILISIPCLAQNSDELRTCMDRAKTQTAINTCAREEAARVDAELNTLYRTLLAAATNDPKAVAKITAAERAWIAYRDAYIAAMWPADDKQEYGTIYPTEVNLLRAKLTRQQITALQELLAQYAPSKR